MALEALGVLAAQGDLGVLKGLSVFWPWGLWKLWGPWNGPGGPGGSGVSGNPEGSEGPG